MNHHIDLCHCVVFDIREKTPRPTRDQLMQQEVVDNPLDVARD